MTRGCAAARSDSASMRAASKLGVRRVHTLRTGSPATHTCTAAIVTYAITLDLYVYINTGTPRRNESWAGSHCRHRQPMFLFIRVLSRGRILTVQPIIKNRFSLTFSPCSIVYAWTQPRSVRSVSFFLLFSFVRRDTLRIE